MHTDDFDFYYHSLDQRSAAKYDQAILYLETIYVLSTKFVKKLENAEAGMYELKV